MTTNLFFWIGLFLSPFLLWIEWEVFKKLFDRPLSIREKVSGFGLILFLTIIVLLTTTGVI